MISFFKGQQNDYYLVQTNKAISSDDKQKLSWLFGEANFVDEQQLKAPTNSFFIGPRASMVSPWSTNAVEITQNMSIIGIERIEQFFLIEEAKQQFDPMLSQQYSLLTQDIFTIHIQPEEIKSIEDISTYNQEEGLALSEEEVAYLNELSQRIGRPLTDSEVFGFSQVNSEHCRHKIFNGTFIIDNKEKEKTLFSMIRETSNKNPNEIVSAYKDNVAFINGPQAIQFAPQKGEKASFYQSQKMNTVLSLKAETHNFPTTVEPFNGAATGSGGEIRDRLAGGTGSIPLAGTAVYMTAYSRQKNEKKWEKNIPVRPWLYQTPLDILIKASNGASDFGNKFGQPLITGSLLTFEHQEDKQITAFDKVIMLAGGIGYGKQEYALKNTPQKGDKIVVMGGDNYRIGMGGAAVSSADTGAFGSGIELNAIQRSNPEMQKRVANAVRAMVESEENPIVSIHDHGAGGHLNCLSELVEETGGKIDLNKLPVGDSTLSMKEIIGNESQERMGLVVKEKDIQRIQQLAERERAPFYVVGDVTGDMRFTFEDFKSGKKPMDVQLTDLFGSSPKTIMQDKHLPKNYNDLSYDTSLFQSYLLEVLQLEAVACKDWLTNKVDRCVGGRVAKQQCVGPLQLPLNNVGVMALDYSTHLGVATSIGHSPISGLIHSGAGSRNSITEALTNLVWAPIEKELAGVSLSANWMWPCKNEGEDARLYEAVEACADFAIQLGINIPTGKDSLSMKQKYKDQEVLSPGTVIISSVGSCSDIRKVVEPVLLKTKDAIYYINFSQDEYQLGGSSFAQTLNKVGADCPDVKNANFVKKAFNVLQTGIKKGEILAGHDVGSGGLITTLLEMCFADNELGASVDLSELSSVDLIQLLFSENAGVVFQAKASFAEYLNQQDIQFFEIGKVNQSNLLEINYHNDTEVIDIAIARDSWFSTSYHFDENQCANNKAKERFENYKQQDLRFNFPSNFDGKLPRYNGKKPIAAVIREKGSNSEREMANALYLAGFDVKDIHMTDLMSGREDLSDVQFLGAVGGFSNSDVLGSAKGWAGSFLYNEKANTALKRFFDREDTLSLGICNGCQLFIELGLINQNHEKKPKMLHNDSHKHESNFTSVSIESNNSVMLKDLAGSTLGVWISHGEGKFDLPYDESEYQIVAKYGYDAYPANPNGSTYNTAMLCDDSGRHLVMMPHIERSIFQWNWAHYPKDRNDEVSPWIKAFVSAREWLMK